MEDLVRSIYQERAYDSNTLGIIVVTKTQLDFPFTKYFDTSFLMVVKEQKEDHLVKQYQVGKENVSIYSIRMEDIIEAITFSKNKKLFDWIYYGKIIFDRNDSLANLRNQFFEYPKNDRDLNMSIEYAKLIKRYKNGKALFEKGHILDAYNAIIHSLHHLARLAVIEKGIHPEVTVWKQVKNIDGQIFKLYEELVFSTEELNKRLELLFLASDFLIYSKIKIYLKHFFKILSEQELWNANDLYNHKELKSYAIDLDTLLEYLLEKKVLYIERESTKNEKIYKLLYKF